MSYVPVGVFQRGDKAGLTGPYPEIIGVPVRGFTEVIYILDVQDTEVDP